MLQIPPCGVRSAPAVLLDWHVERAARSTSELLTGAADQCALRGHRRIRPLTTAEEDDGAVASFSEGGDPADLHLN
jgi:hypothetical protein